MDYKVKNQNGRKPNSKVHRHIYISTSFPHERLSKLPEPSRAKRHLTLVKHNYVNFSYHATTQSRSPLPKMLQPSCTTQWWIQERGPGAGGAGPPPYFSTKLRPEGPPNFCFWDCPLFSQGLDDRQPPPPHPLPHPLPYLKVGIRLCYRTTICPKNFKER